ncbi:MAG: glycosyltransferase family 39 protein [Chloroflexota bacterium]
MAAEDLANESLGYSNTTGPQANARRGSTSRLASIALSPALLLTLFTVVGLTLRLYRLDARGLWFDEISFAYPVRMNSSGEVFALAASYSDTSPLSFYLTWLMRGFGGGEWSVRMPFVILGTLCIPAVYLLGREMARPRVGLLAALMMALSPFAIFYSQDVHAYAPLLLFTILQVLFAYRAVNHGGVLDWLAFSLFSILNLYNDYIALIVSAVVALFLMIVLLARLVALLSGRARLSESRDGVPVTLRGVGVQIMLAAVSAAVIFVAYLPWLPYAQRFLVTRGNGFDRLPVGKHGTLADLQALLQGLGFNALLLLFLVIGLAYVLVTLVRERRLSSLLLFVWLGLPLAAFWVNAGDAMLLLKMKYYSFLFPALVLLAAMGVDWLVGFAARLYVRFAGGRETRRPKAYGTVLRASYAAVLVVLLAQAPVALAESYAMSKEIPQDYRGAAARIVADSPPGSMAIGLGMWGIKPAPSFIVDGLDYYLWLHNSTVQTIDGSLLDEARVARLANDAIVWGAVGLPEVVPPEQLQRAREIGLEVIPFDRFTLLRQQAPRGSPAEQIDRLLEWGMGLQPGLVAARSLLNPAFRTTTLGENMLPPPSGDAQSEQESWSLGAGASLAQEGNAFVLSADGSQEMVNVTLPVHSLVPGRKYVLLFHYNNEHLQGEQRVFVSTLAGDGHVVDTFPYGDGFLCPLGAPSVSAFAFAVPTNSSSALLWLRIVGTGSAEFSSVELRPVR